MNIFGYDISFSRNNMTAAERSVTDLQKTLEAVSKATTPKATDRAVGVPGLASASGRVKEEFLDKLTWPDAGKVYQEMASNEAVIGGCLYLIETLIRKARWYVKPASDDAGDLEAASFLESCMFDMTEQTWDTFVCEVLTMLTYGFSFHEVLYKVRRGPLEKDLRYKSKFTDGKIGWQEIPGRSQTTLSEWTIDTVTGKALEFVQDPGLVGLDGKVVKIPLAGNLLFRTKATRGNPEGWSLLRRAYRSWYFKKYIEELEGIGIERSLAGIPVLSPPANVPLFDPDNVDMVRLLGWATSLITQLRQDRNHGVILPSIEWELKLLGSEGQKAVDTDTVIRRHETRMAMSMLSDIVVMGGDRTGSFALAETKQSLFIHSLQSIIGSIASTLNTYAVPSLFAVNGWALEKLPEITADDLDTPSIKEIALLLRSFKTDITRDQKLFNFVLDLMQAPQLTAEEFTSYLANQQAAEAAQEAPVDDIEGQDTAENDLKPPGDA